MSSAVSLKQLIQQMMPKGNEVIVGLVVSENPLIIQAVNDEKLKISPIISKKFYDEPLKIGEYVHMLSFNNDKQYFVLDRAVM